MPTPHTATLPPPRAIRAWRFPALKASVIAWLMVAAVGQLIFAAYVISLYGGAALGTDPARWNRVTPHAHVVGDAAGNALFASHVLFTVIVVGGGLLQLLPAVRRRVPALHRWNGRVYVVAASLLAVGGVVMMLTRGTVGSFWQQMGTAANAAVVLLCAAMAWRHARARRFADHRTWALRMFLAVSGVWFFRIGLMAWLMIHRAPVGFDPKTFTGPFLLVLAYAQFLLPLLVLELVLRAQASQHALLRGGTAALMAVLTAFTALGVVGATLLMWWPRM